MLYQAVRLAATPEPETPVAVMRLQERDVATILPEDQTVVVLETGEVAALARAMVLTPESLNEILGTSELKQRRFFRTAARPDQLFQKYLRIAETPHGFLTFQFRAGDSLDRATAANIAVRALVRQILREDHRRRQKQLARTESKIREVLERRHVVEHRLRRLIERRDLRDNQGASSELDDRIETCEDELRAMDCVAQMLAEQRYSLSLKIESRVFKIFRDAIPREH